MFEPRIMAASSLWQPLIFLRTQTCERRLPLEPDVELDFKISKLCEKQISLEPDFKPKSFILNWKFSNGL